MKLKEKVLAENVEITRGNNPNLIKCPARRFLLTHGQAKNCSL